MFFIYRNKVPQGDEVTYCNIFCDIRPQKKDIRRVKITVKGLNITFYGSVSTPTSNLTTYKLHCNIFLSTPGSKYLVVDVNKFYLNNPISKHGYYKISLSLTPQDTIYK